ncbi:hypothetical protein Pan44_24310 [Caulifigura coniformis]|uniref:Choice-of-anchor A domain-containing protein n=1 Tax=Caulifigura coniformis TaxID=2527983 RepID=A0A517SE57_9PLAN|nr:choice-of-anchor A family protein [Caulifigura coniformis]QDT54398.1 hypothetical protein Pan44_24310 [Caulifigura coniformis]
MLKPLGACLVLSAILLTTRSASAELIPGYENVIGGNLNGQAQIEGRTIVRGDVLGGFAQFGTGLVPPAVYANADTLLVGGNLQSSGLTMHAGDVRLGGTNSGATVNLNGPGSELFQNDSTALSSANAAVSQLGLASDFYSNAAVNSTTTIVGTNITLNPLPGPDGLAVLAVNAVNIQNALFSLAVAGVPPDTRFLINVVGNLSSDPILANFDASFADPAIYSRILWNFQDQTSELNLSREWYGSILLPDASLVTTSAINGMVLVGGDFTSSSEVRFPEFQGFTPFAVPELSSFFLATLAGLGYLVSRRKRDRKSDPSIGGPISR